MTRQTFLTRVRQMSDTLNDTTEYPDELLKDLAGMVHLDEWRKLLGEAPYYQTAARTVTLDDQRTFAWSALTTGTGNAVQTAFRVLEIADREGENLTYAQPDRVRLADLSRLQTTQKLWTRNGARVQTFGTTGGDTLTVLVNYVPCSLANLASDADVVDFPDEWLPVLFYETAALVLTKGGREIGAANDLLRMADMLRQKMLADIRRYVGQPYILGADDGMWEWGA